MLRCSLEHQKLRTYVEAHSFTKIMDHNKQIYEEDGEWILVGSLSEEVIYKDSWYMKTIAREYYLRGFYYDVVRSRIQSFAAWSARADGSSQFRVALVCIHAVSQTRINTKGRR